MARPLSARPVGRRWKYSVPHSWQHFSSLFHVVTFCPAFEATDLFCEDGTALKGWKWDSDLNKFVRTEAET